MIVLNIKNKELFLRANKMITLDEDTAKILGIMANRRRITSRELAKELYGSSVFFFRIWDNMRFLRQYLNIYMGRNGYKLLDKIYITY